MRSRQLALPERFRLTPPPARPGGLSLGFTVALIPKLDRDAPALLMRVWLPGPEDATAPAAVEFDRTDADSDAIGARWAALLRRLYPRDSAKAVARAFDCEIATAKGWLAGQAPLARSLAMAAYLHGAEVVAEVLAPGAPWAPQRIATALCELQSRLAFLNDKVVALRAA